MCYLHPAASTDLPGIQQPFSALEPLAPGSSPDPSAVSSVLHSSVRNTNSHPLASLQEWQESWGRRNVLLAAASSLCSEIAHAPLSVTYPHVSCASAAHGLIPTRWASLGYEVCWGKKRNVQITRIISEPKPPCRAVCQDWDPQHTSELSPFMTINASLKKQNLNCWNQNLVKHHFFACSSAKWSWRGLLANCKWLNERVGGQTHKGLDSDAVSDTAPVLSSFPHLLPLL